MINSMFCFCILKQKVNCFLPVYFQKIKEFEFLTIFLRHLLHYMQAALPLTSFTVKFQCFFIDMENILVNKNKYKYGWFAFVAKIS